MTSSFRGRYRKLYEAMAVDHLKQRAEHWRLLARCLAPASASACAAETARLFDDAAERLRREYAA